MQPSPAALNTRPARAQGLAPPRSRALAVAVRASSSSSATPALPPVAKPTLYDVPVSNNGARVRYVVYSQGLDVAIEPPTALGGLKSEAYLSLNPQGKMPLLRLPETEAAGNQGVALAVDKAGKQGAAAAIAESEVIVDYLLDRYCPPGTLMAPDPLSRARQRLATRVHDMYVTTAQGCMYKGGMTPGERSAGLAALALQLDALEAIVAAGGGPYVAGACVTTADSALAPTFEFMTFILPRVFGWKDVFAGRPALRRWWAAVREDAAMKRVLDEVRGGLEAWEAGDRWGQLGITEQVKKAEAKYAF